MNQSPKAVAEVFQLIYIYSFKLKLTLQLWKHQTH